MSDLDALGLGGDDEQEPGRHLLTTFALAVLAALVGVSLLGLLLYGLGAGGAVLWAWFWRDFA